MTQLCWFQTRVEIIRNDGSSSDTSGSIDMESDFSNTTLDSLTDDMATLPRALRAKQGSVTCWLVALVD